MLDESKNPRVDENLLSPSENPPINDLLLACSASVGLILRQSAPPGVVTAVATAEYRGRCDLRQKPFGPPAPSRVRTARSLPSGQDFFATEHPHARVE